MTTTRSGDANTAKSKSRSNPRLGANQRRRRTVKFRKKPVVIEAMQLTESNHGEIERWGSPHICASPVLEPGDENPSGVYLQIATLEGVMTAIPGDWIIRGVKGE